MIVGVSGPSCSGKTSLARELAALLDAPVLHLDRHFVADAERPVVAGHPSFERPHQYDGAALLAEMLAAAEGHRHVVAEGFLLFAYPGVLEACGAAWHLDVPHEVLVERRTGRDGAAGDVLGGRIAAADRAWAAHGREEWERFGAFQATLPGVEVLRPLDADPRPDAAALARAIAAARGLSA